MDDAKVDYWRGKALRVLSRAIQELGQPKSPEEQIGLVEALAAMAVTTLCSAKRSGFAKEVVESVTVDTIGFISDEIDKQIGMLN